MEDVSDEHAIERDELMSILRERCDQDFDGECHLTNAEADRIITFLATPPVTGEVGELVEARDLLSKASSWLAMDSVVNHGDLVQQIDAFLARTSGTLPPTEQPS